jgi:hypothetical protein
MEQAKQQRWWERLGGYLLIPHELLHILGFRLVGKRCNYRWGNNYVTPLGSMSRWERLVGMLFPFVVFAILFIIGAVWVGLAYGQAVREGSFFRFIFGLILLQIIALYAGSTLLDLRNAYLLIFNKPWQSWTPLDIFFWPIVDWTKVRERTPPPEDHDKQD